MLSLERWNVDQVFVFDVGNGALLPLVLSVFGSSFLLFLLLRALFFLFFDICIFFISVVFFVFCIFFISVVFFVFCIFVTFVIFFCTFVIFVFFFCIFVVLFVFFFVCIFFFNDLFFLFDLFLVFLLIGVITSGCSTFRGRMGAELRGP
ncbi:hypothetical protein PF007_g32948 [Phytophthora fragariae]|uniref:Uncharacterized protein n=1 Tax=Phytophthora fragariae TaxID=53985 RepID=A0A6A3PC39_9STRA|nr:hypothetical protein PF007_g32948 [Phytophthora fragariae]